MAQREDSSSDTAPGVAAALADPGRWSDLGVRMASGAAMAVLGALAVMMGGLWFQMLTVFVTAVMVWELWMMIEPGKPTPGMLLAALCASVLSGQLSNGDTWVLWLFLIAPLAGAAMLRRERLTFWPSRWASRWQAGASSPSGPNTASPGCCGLSSW